MKLHKLSRKKYADGGASQGFFTQNSYENIKPIMTEAYNVKDYVKEAKESDDNRLRAFHDMRVAESLMTDQEKAKMLTQTYEDRFNQAANELSNPFAIDRFARKQAIDYVNNPLRINIEESSKNRTESIKNQKANKDGDEASYKGHLLLNDYLFKGTNENKDSVYQGPAPVNNIDPLKVHALANQVKTLDKHEFGTLDEATKYGLEGMGYNKTSWSEATVDSRLKALAKLSFNSDPAIIRNLEGHAFNDIYTQARNNGASDLDAKKIAYKRYKTKAQNDVEDLATNSVKAMTVNSNGFKLNEYALPVNANGSGSGGGDSSGFDSYTEINTAAQEVVNADNTTRTDELNRHGEYLSKDAKSKYNRLTAPLLNGKTVTPSNVVSIAKKINDIVIKYKAENKTNSVGPIGGLSIDSELASRLRKAGLPATRVAAENSNEILNQVEKTNEATKWLKDVYGYQDSELKNPEAVISIYEKLKGDGPKIKSTTFMPSAANRQYMNDIVQLNLPDSEISDGDNPNFKNYETFTHDFGGSMTDKEEVRKELEAKNYIYKGLSFRKKGNTTVPTMNILFRNKNLYVEAPPQFVKELSDFSKLKHQLITGGTNNEFVTIDIPIAPNVSEKHRVRYTMYNGEPLLEYDKNTPRNAQGLPVSSNGLVLSAGTIGAALEHKIDLFSKHYTFKPTTEIDKSIKGNQKGTSGTALEDKPE